MTQALVLLITFAIGVGIGWLAGRRVSSAPRRAIVVTAAVLLGTPVLLFVFANILGSDALGWIAGLSMLLIVASGPPLAVGAVVGWAIARKRIDRAPKASGLESAGSKGQMTSNVTDARPAQLVGSITSSTQVAWTDQRSLFIAMAGVAAGFWVAIALGFRLNDQQAPEALDNGLLPAALVLFGTVSLGVRRLWRNRGELLRVPSTVRFSRGRSDELEERRTWLATLAADPQRQRYATMIAGGDLFWTPDRVEYDLDPNATTSCEHLAPIESAMRAAGVHVRLDAAGSASADCRIDSDALARRFALPPSVTYEELQAYDRSLEDPPQARLRCSLCESRVWVVHPSESGIACEKGARVFPSAE